MALCYRTNCGVLQNEEALLSAGNGANQARSGGKTSNRQPVARSQVDTASDAYQDRSAVFKREQTIWQTAATARTAATATRWILPWRRAMTGAFLRPRRYLRCRSPT